ncbi:transglutaminase-like domain-containing protein [Maribacter sp. HTCC2170]|uniref:transglutaminase-like domain-containing protein n=1 Tax=Maribacter sp. (strain HTCC2170 / KCCM 42371) TaxID=313603 RepID=UPI00006B471F|nr:transglutaminase-like domain-containing protein [Maribacter sp. HTCC2170]EAR01982.1 hypothetical protein FB2170_15678 [Maribacter sp. HTCC2170]
MIEILKILVAFNSIKIILISILLAESSNLCAQDLSISTKSEHIKIEKDSSFVRDISVNLKESPSIIAYPILYDSELEVVSDIQVLLKKGKRFKPMKEIIKTEDDVELDYIASKKMISVIIPVDTEAKITYKVNCKELMYFSDLRFFSYNKIDTLRYKLTIPNDFSFAHNTIYKDSLSHITFDSINLAKETKYQIEAVPLKVDPDPLMLFGIYRNKKIPFMRTIVAPVSYKDIESEYLNDWYLDKVKPQRGLTKEVLTKIDDLTEGETDAIKTMNILYDYVRTNFKYVAIEIGMGAFIPTHTNQVYTDKQGDCKDLSNFLVEALNYKGIKSNIALASTFNHISDCDFPSLSSANHAICVAYIDNKPIILDPTDVIHTTFTPVESLQNRSIFIINEEGGEFHKIKNFDNQDNLIDYELNLAFDSDKMSLKGIFNTTYNGISGNFIKRRIRNAEKKDEAVTCTNHFESVFGNGTISKIETNENSNALSINGNISILGKVFNDGNNRLLFIDFLPRLFESTERESLLKGTHIGNNFNKKVKVVIQMAESFQMFDPIEHSFKEEGATLKIKTKALSDSSIEYNYDFNFDYVNIDKNNQSLTNQLLKEFKQTLNVPIVLSK